MAIGALRPKSWSEFIGQENMKTRLQIHIKAANEREEQLDNILLLGPAGTGKTTIAKLIADEAMSEFTSIIMGQMKIPMLLDTIVNTEGVLLLDELHKLSPKEQEILLPVLTDNCVQMPYGSEPLRYPLTIIGASTERDKVLQTIRDRFKIVPEFEDYSFDEMRQIIQGMVRQLDECEMSEETALALAKATGGMPRQAERIVLCARDLNSDNPKEILNLAGLTEEGLTTLHLKYLAALRQNNGGVAGVEVLSASLRLDRWSTIDLERLLTAQDMIEYTSKGRSLKARGAKVLAENRDLL